MAFCTKCGKQLNDGAAFCPNCGQAVGAPPKTQSAEAWSAPAAQQPNTQWTPPATPQTTYQAPAVPQPTGSAPLVMGILAMVFAWTGLLGIIFGAIAIKRANAWRNQGIQSGKATAGRILGIIGLIGGICMVVYWTVLIILAIVAFIGNAIA